MDSPFIDIPVREIQSFNQWNNEDEIANKSPLLDPLQVKGFLRVNEEISSENFEEYLVPSASESSTENFSGEMDDYQSDKLSFHETDATNEEYETERTSYYEHDLPAIKSKNDDELNRNYSEDLGWGNYIYEINDLLLKATKQSNKTLFSASFISAVIEWKRQNGFSVWNMNGTIDLETWKTMAASIGVAPLIFSINDAYAKMGLSGLGLSFDAFKFACNGYRKLDKQGQLKNNKILSIADFTQSSNNKRLYLLDLAGHRILLQTKVAHGANSVKRGDPKDKATLFSNIDGSHQSSLGFYITQETFTMRDHIDSKGKPHKRGYSLYIKGMEKGFNDLARKRSIWIHPAEYVDESSTSTTDTSWGCPAIDFKVRTFVIDTIKEGTCFFIYFNDPDYLGKSLLLPDSSFGVPVKFSHEYENEHELDYEETPCNMVDEFYDEPPENENEYDDEAIENLLDNEFNVDPKYGVTDYLNVSAVKDSSLLTGVFIPAGFVDTGKVDMVIYLHGQFKNGNKNNGIEYYWGTYANIRCHFYNSQRNAILLAPILCSDPQDPNWHKHCDNHSPILLRNKNGLDDFVAACFTELKSKKCLQASAQPNRIILAAHSAGGCILSKILGATNTLLDNVIECWGFDCLYGYSFNTWLSDPKNAAKIFYHYWAWSCKHADNSCPKVNGMRLAKLYPGNFKNIDPGSKVPHPQIIEHAWINEINKRTWFDPISSAAVVPELNESSFESENDEYDIYNEDEFIENDEVLEYSDEAEYYETYNSEMNRYKHEEDIEGEDEDEVEDNQYEEAESEDSVNIDFQIPQERLKKWRDRYIPLLDKQKSRDKNDLTNFIFWDLHPDIKTRGDGKLVKSDSEKLKREWKDIYDQIVSPYLLTYSILPSCFSPGKNKQLPGMSPESVQYLALEGGGGRGAVYIGAIMALEKQGILPISRNKIKGISGSSAGAITAFLLSLGYTGSQIQDELFLQKNLPPVFTNFINDIEPGCFRMITKDLKATYRKPRVNEVSKNFEDADLALIKNIFESLKSKHPYLSTLAQPLVEVLEKNLPKIIFSSLDLLMIYLLKMGAPMIGNALYKLDMGTKIPSIYNLLHDGGYFTGLGVRQILQTRFNEFNRTKDNRYDSNINFEQFLRLTGVDLKITGTNITQGFGAYFSAETTPEFPVIEAVGISGCFPFVFKPVFVESDKPIMDRFKIYDERKHGYKDKTLYGFWADGGIANNLPLHAFDEGEILNKNVLALRLTPPKKNRSNLLQMTNPTTVRNFTLDYYTNLLAMLTDSSESSQIRTGAEAYQTIDLETGSLETTDFTPNPAIWGAYSSMAFAKVSAYFEGR